MNKQFKIGISIFILVLSVFMLVTEPTMTQAIVVLFVAAWALCNLAQEID